MTAAAPAQVPAAPELLKRSFNVGALSSASGPTLQRACACGGAKTGHEECEGCRKAKSPLRRWASGEPAPLTAPPIIHEVLRSPGRPLDPATRLSMEERFGHDFSRVRVHDDARAAASAHAVGALAYTVGRDVVFGAGRYAPHTAEGRSLLAHELAHVVQQSAAPYGGGDLRLGEAQGVAEREADDAARLRDSDGPPAIGQRGRPEVQGRWDWKRAGLGALIGGVAGLAAGGLLGLALGPAALLGGIGALVGGVFGGRALGGGVTSCTRDQEGTIMAALRQGLAMLHPAMAALAASSRTSTGSDRAARAREALRRYFGSNDERVANHVLQRLGQVKDLMSTLLQRHRPGEPQRDWREAVAPAMSCHTEADKACAVAQAYMTPVDPVTRRREGMVFCPTFFAAPSDRERGSVIIHEATHALLGQPHIKDIAYTDRRYFSGLTTAEALVNADSYRIFVLHVAGTTEPSVPSPDVPSVGCSQSQDDRIDEVAMRARRWTAFAERFTADRNPKLLADKYWVGLRRRYLGGDSLALLEAATRAYGRAAFLLEIIFFGQCHLQADTVCPAGTVATWEPEGLTGTIHVCPDWLGEPDLDRQTVFFLRAIIEGAGETDPKKQLAYAEMAGTMFAELYLPFVPTLEDILRPPAPAGRPKGDFPERALPVGVEVG